MSSRQQLQTRIAQCEEALASHPRGHLEIGYRYAIESALGPRRPEFGTSTPGYLRRLALGRLTVEKVLPLWEAVYQPSHPAFQLLFREWKDSNLACKEQIPALPRTLLEAIPPIATGKITDFWEAHCVWANFEPILLQLRGEAYYAAQKEPELHAYLHHLWIPWAASTYLLLSIYESQLIRFYSWQGEGRVIVGGDYYPYTEEEYRTLTDAQVYLARIKNTEENWHTCRQHFPPEYCACIAFAGGSVVHNETSPEQVSAFWKWWLREAVPKAWESVPEEAG